MVKRLLVVVGSSVAAGYVLGARAGRQRYEQIMGVATRVKQDPRIQDATQKVTGAVKEAPFVKDRLGGAGASEAEPAAAADWMMDSEVTDLTALQENPNPVV